MNTQDFTEIDDLLKEIHQLEYEQQQQEIGTYLTYIQFGNLLCLMKGITNPAVRDVPLCYFFTGWWFLKGQHMTNPFSYFLEI